MNTDLPYNDDGGALISKRSEEKQKTKHEQTNKSKIEVKNKKIANRRIYKKGTNSCSRVNFTVVVSATLDQFSIYLFCSCFVFCSHPPTPTTPLSLSFH